MLRPSRSAVVGTWLLGSRWRRVKSRRPSPPPSAPQDWECRRWAAGLRHAKAQPLGGVGTWLLESRWRTSQEPRPAPPPSAPQDWECRRWAAGLRHAKAQPLDGVGTWLLGHGRRGAAVPELRAGRRKELLIEHLGSTGRTWRTSSAMCWKQRRTSPQRSARSLHAPSRSPGQEATCILQKRVDIVHHAGGREHLAGAQRHNEGPVL